MTLANAALPGSGITVRFARDDGRTFLGMTVPAESFSLGAMIATLRAIPGLSTSELARVDGIREPMAHYPPGAVMAEGSGFVTFKGPANLTTYVLRDDARTHLSYGEAGTTYAPGGAAAALVGSTGISATEVARVNMVGVPRGYSGSAALPPITTRAFDGTLIGYGDSRIQAQYTDFPTNSTLSSRNYLTVARALSGNRLIAGNNYGKAGDTSTQGLARLNAVVAEGARYVVVQFGVNDFAANATSATVFANVQQMCEAIIANGVSEPILVLDPGSGTGAGTPTGPLTAAQAAQLFDYNAKLNAYATSRGLKIFDPRPYILSSANDTYPITFISGRSEDSLHTNLRGGQIEGVGFWNWFSQFIPNAPSLAFTGADLLTNSNLATTTGGTITSGQGSGTLPAGFTGVARGAAGATAVCSVNTLGDGTKEIVVTVTFTSAATYLNQQAFSIEQAITASKLAIGDMFEGAATIAVDAGATGLTGVTSFIRYQSSASGLVLQYDMFPDVNAAYNTVDGGITYTTRTKPLTIAGTPTEASWYVRAYGGAAGTATFRIRAPRAMKK